MSGKEARGGARWRRRVLVLALALAGALAAAEVALRALGRFAPDPTWYAGEFENRPSENFVTDPETGWRMRPEHRFARPAQGVEIEYRSDAGGFRTDPALPGPRREATVAVVGDSQAWAFGVPYAASFGVLLGEALGGARVVNLAQPGFGVDQIGLALRHQALPLEPDLVVVAIFRDDFNRSLQAYRRVEGFNKPTFVLDGGALRPRTPADRPAAPVVYLERNLHLFGLVREALRKLGWLAPDTRWRDLNLALLDRMVADAEEAGVPLVFVSIPPGGERFEPLERWAESAGAPFVDPARTPPDGDEELYLPDRHLTEAGHRWVADCLVRHLRAERPELFGP